MVRAVSAAQSQQSPSWPDPDPLLQGLGWPPAPPGPLRAARAPCCALDLCSRCFCQVLKQIYLRCSLAQRGFGILMTARKVPVSAFSYSQLLQVLLSMDKTTRDIPYLCFNPGQSHAQTPQSQAGSSFLKGHSISWLREEINPSPYKARPGFISSSFCSTGDPNCRQLKQP